MGSVTIWRAFFAFVAVVLAVVVAFTVRGIVRDTPPEEIETSPDVAPLTTVRCDSFLMTATLAELPANVVSGQTLYVPVYSHVQHVGGRLDRLTAKLSVRNTDVAHPITVTVVDFCDTDGELVRSYVDSPQELGPLAMAQFVADWHTAGGAGATFIVEWVAVVEVTEPVVEAVMALTTGMRGMAFVSRGVVIGERQP